MLLSKIMEEKCLLKIYIWKIYIPMNYVQKNKPRWKWIIYSELIIIIVYKIMLWNIAKK